MDPVVVESEKHRREHRGAPPLRIRLPNLFDQDDVGYWEWSNLSDGFEVDVQYFERYGYSERDLCPLTVERWRAMIHPKDEEETVRQFFDVLGRRTETLNYRHRLRIGDGKWAWFHVCGRVTARTSNGTPLRIAGTVHEIGGVVRAERAIRLHDRLFSLLHRSAKTLLESTAIGFETVLRDVLDRLGRVSGTDRVLLVRYARTPDDRFRMDRVCEWSRESGVARNVVGLPDPSFDGAGSDWGIMPVSGRCICNLSRRRLPPAERHLLASRGILSALFAPIAFGRTFWGMLCFGDCRRKRRWTGPERGVLKSVGLQIAATLCRHAAERAWGTEDDLTGNAPFETERDGGTILPFRLSEVIDEVVLPVRSQAGRKGLRFTVKIEPSVEEYLLGDPFRLKRILCDVTAQAVRFTRRGEIRLQVDRCEEENAAIHSEETGLLFSISDIGTGSGLSIPRRLVEMAGGSIYVDEELDRGSILRFTAKFRRPVG